MIKEIEYCCGNKQEVIVEGVYNNHKYVIINLGTHPCAYVTYSVTADWSDIDVHGGITYEGESYWESSPTSNWIGWDYAHSGDYLVNAAGICLFGDKKWSTAEILIECVKVIDQLVRLETASDVNRSSRAYKLLRDMKAVRNLTTLCYDLKDKCEEYFEHELKCCARAYEDDINDCQFEYTLPDGSACLLPLEEYVVKIL